MWKVTNRDNNIYLEKFEEKIIQPIFDIILEVSKKRKRKLTSSSFWKNTIVYKSLSVKDKSLIDYIMQVIVNKESFSKVTLQIINNYSYAQLEAVYIVYLSQNALIKFKFYGLIKEIVPHEIKTLFVDFYYNRFFNDKVIWNILMNSDYSRTIFHENFKKENMLSVCPYCDIDTFVSNSNKNVEHFYPKSKFPLVCMNAYNLISSCIACNKAHEGKGDTSPKSPVVTPYSEEINEKIKFEINFSERKISFVNLGDITYENYFDLLKLNTRYQSEVVFDSLDIKAETLFNICTIAGKVNPDVLKNYLREKSKDENLMVALNHLIKEYPRYKAMSP
ncbi:hypothetical protein J2B92_19445 [Lysinibacillus sphaericus]|uniref:hypothetical protein n=1 Tax=Lysinibacillus sphaericus TaxID=1421 RepID=UPI0018CE160A|nr:hypothetical protein [Lysinibacillus sphaericus]MBG9757298.1 hypothetical protein [Lysinibacillus sphaericus]QTB12946.1 hypothetical protein J2B92_19445 [Lysinibacillus sphaericus]